MAFNSLHTLTDSLLLPSTRGYKYPRLSSRNRGLSLQQRSSTLFSIVLQLYLTQTYTSARSHTFFYPAIQNQPRSTWRTESITPPRQWTHSRLPRQQRLPLLRNRQPNNLQPSTTTSKTNPIFEEAALTSKASAAAFGEFGRLPAGKNQTNG